jgi:polysaccharide export outer membrane protein
VRYLNHRVSVLGEVNRPGVIQMPEERLSVLEVLSTSGDVTAFARRNNILIIRETANGKELKRLNFEDHSIFTSDWYYLQPDDVVYVEPNEKKLNDEKRNKTQQTVGLILSGVSLAVIILDRIIK